MRLALITGSLVHGGAERQAITLANRLAERGHECHAIYIKNDPSQLSRLRLPPPATVRCLHARRYFDLGALSHLHALLTRLAPQAVAEKNPAQLVQAVAQLCKQGLPARALFIGDGPERGAVEAMARKLQIANRVVISGLQEDVRPFLSVCDVVALTSFTEAFSLAAIEAMSLGRPGV